MSRRRLEHRRAVCEAEKEHRKHTALSATYRVANPKWAKVTTLEHDRRLDAVDCSYIWQDSRETRHVAKLLPDDRTVEHVECTLQVTLSHDM